MTRRATIAIVGAGFTGTVLAVQLLERLRQRAAITLVDAGGSFGPGVAYGTQHPHLLLNAPAAAMSAIAGDAEHFSAWLAQHGEAVPEDGFVARRLYGAYLRQLLDDAALRSDVPLTRVVDEVIALARLQGGGYRLTYASGVVQDVDVVALCTGYGRPPAAAGARRIVANPWAEDWPDRVGPRDLVVFKGCGLTMIDQVLRLEAAGHRGPLLAVSRRGQLPRAHARGVGAAPADGALLPPGGRLLPLLRAVRARARAGDWRAVVDGLRPASQALWRALRPTERRRFARHLRPYWDSHRHRMPPAVADIIARLRGEGRLAIRAGRIVAVAPDAAGIRVSLRRRGCADIETYDAAWLVDCTGFDGGLHESPLGWSLLGAGLARTEGGRVVLDLDADATLLDAAGSRAEGAWALGPPGWRHFLEITAAPEIAVQCRDTATAILARLEARHLERAGRRR
jgi:uncharacterized NAD(P)/FAD-binding protein YdhS